MRKWFFLLFPFLAFATVNEPLRLEVFSGYRNDRLHWHLQQPDHGGVLTYSELYRNLQFWENGLALKAIYRDLVFIVKGSYGAFGAGGTLFQKYADLNFTPLDVKFQFQPEGWAADAAGYFGYAVNLTPDRNYKLILIPLLGYSGHFEHLQRKHATPNPYSSDSAVGASSFEMVSSLPQQLHQTWYGFLLGGAVQFESEGRFVLQAGYNYHWENLLFKTHFEYVTDLLDGESLVDRVEIRTKVKNTKSDALGQTGWAQIDYLFSKLWRLGLGLQIHYFSSSVLDAKLTQANGTENTSFSEKLKVRWTPVAGWIQTSRSF